MDKEILTIGKRQAAVFLPSGCTDCPIVYTHLSAEDAASVSVQLINLSAVLVAIDGVEWEAELSPWPAQKAFRGGIDFTGKAEEYLQELCEIILPSVEGSFNLTPRSRSIAGYSLAGLFAVYALYKTELFHSAASISGSLWYDDFLDYMKENRPCKLPERVYFSLGDRESITNNQRLSKVEQCTREAEQLLSRLGTKTTFELNPGNHFADVTERIAKGIRWLL